MKGEINREWYCSGINFLHNADEYGGSGTAVNLCRVNFNENGYWKCCHKKCKFSCYHRKYPTPEQFFEEYGEEYPDEGAVYSYNDYEAFIHGSSIFWELMTFSKARKSKKMCICACTPWGKPPNDWRPE